MAKLQPNRLDWLDALRAWAVVGVVMVHSGQVAHSTGLALKISAAGQYGVQLFFVISALTISITYESHIARFGRSTRSQFAWLIKRFFRIAPLYYLAAFFYPAEQYAISILSHKHDPAGVSIRDLLANLLFLHTWIPSANNSVVPGGWSIGVETFFYALVPFVWLIVPVRRRIIWLSISALGFLMATILVRKLSNGTFYVENDSYLYYWFPTQAPVIIFGLIFYFFHGSKLQDRQSSKVAGACLGGFLICLLVAMYFGTGNEVAPVLAPAIVGVAFIFLAMSVQGWTRYIVVNNYTIFLGKISFGIYIFHFVVLDLLRAFFQGFRVDRSGPLAIIPILVTAIVLTSGIAFISKRIIEDPAIAFGHRLSRSVASERV
jgi:peptidoglycan/LPS O-acetylase OafA/YrhL